MDKAGAVEPLRCSSERRHVIEFTPFRAQRERSPYSSWAFLADGTLV
jgi:hypothetical protein